MNYFKEARDYTILCEDGTVLLKKDSPESKALIEHPLVFEGKKIGQLKTTYENPEFPKLVSCLMHKQGDKNLFSYLMQQLEWVGKAKDLYPEIADWVGIYFKASYLTLEDSTDLLLGPYLGESTDHVRIGLDKGICGLALREERVVNVEDVHGDPRHIACSIKTNSELVIPLAGKDGSFVAELDIDSNRPNAFSKEIEKSYYEFAKTFQPIQ